MEEQNTTSAKSIESEMENASKIQVSMCRPHRNVLNCIINIPSTKPRPATSTGRTSFVLQQITQRKKKMNGKGTSGLKES